MTYTEAVLAMHRAIREAAELHANLRAAYAVLGVRYGTDVRLPVEPGCSPTEPVRDELRLGELRRPYVARVDRDGLPGRSWIVCGDTEDDVLARVPAERPGPNGPIEGHGWLRYGKGQGADEGQASDHR